MTGNNKDFKIFILLLVFLGLFGGGFLYVVKKKIAREAELVVISVNKAAVKKTDKKISFSDDAKIKIKIGSSDDVLAEVAQSDAKKHTGLGGRNSLAAGDGMLFVFDSSSNYSFWNKDMLFAIDLVWIQDGAVVDVTEDMPDFKTSPNYTVTPKGAVNLVLEVNTGFIKEHNIKIGDKITMQ